MRRQFTLHRVFAYLLCIATGACAATPKAARQASEPPAASADDGYVTVAKTDPMTDEVIGNEATSHPALAAGPAWLSDIAEGDVLTYQGQTSDRDSVRAQWSVERLVRRGPGVAALMVPRETPPATELASHWLVGDETGLYRLPEHESLANPGFVPLDSAGHVSRAFAQQAKWRVPAAWHGTPSDAVEWTVDELELTLEGPIRGQRCARVRGQAGEENMRLTVCADLGVVEWTSSGPNRLTEHWRLSRIQRREQ